MCGITGIIYTDKYGDPAGIKKMSDAIAHRGPDGEGFLAINSRTRTVTALAGKKTPVSLPPLENFCGEADVYLAHRRLAIIDLSTSGHQPMSNADGTLWITFNGEIYNYKALRGELSEFEFKSSTDTEVLLCAYQKWGERCLDRLNGMFSFVIYDKKKNMLFGARDRFGVKPFYYVNDSSFFAFNSEIKGLMALSQVPRNLNHDVASSFLRTGNFVYWEDTFFKTVKELLPAHSFTYSIDTHSLGIKKYYELDFTDEWQKFDEAKEKEYIQGVKDRILESVRLRLNSDVTAGSCLSGGMDSSSIVCSISELLKKESFSSLGAKQGVVTACYDDKRIDESSWARLVSEKAGARWFPVYPKKEELLDDLQDLVYSQDYPFGSTSIYAQYRVMKTARENGLTVMLDGQGGDELFTGYTPYYSMFYREANKNHDKTLLANEQEYIKNTPLQSMPKMHVGLMPLAIRIGRTILPRPARQAILHFMPGIDPFHKYINVTGKTWQDINYSTLNQMLHAYITVISLPELLRYEDRNSMRFSIESRTPFADDINLIEYVFKIPSVYKIHNGWSKYLLRESMKGIIPDAVRLRTDKIGFATPEYEWLRDIKEILFSGYNPELNEILNMKKLENDWDDIYIRQNKAGITQIWRFINFILWFNRYSVIA